jgi:uncharacterized membrane protein
MKSKNLEQLLQKENEHLTKLQTIVKQTIKDEELIINNLMHPVEESLTTGQSLSDKIARFGGSWTFIILFLISLAFWILLNTLLPQDKSFDPFPFILMNLILSSIAALQAPVIMMSQNRQEEKDRKRAQNDYLINLKAELEIRSLHQKIDLLIEDQLKTIYEIQLQQLEILKELQEKPSTN